MGTYEVTVTAEVPIEDTEWMTDVFEVEADSEDEAGEEAVDQMHERNFDAVVVYVEAIFELDTEDE